MPGLHSLLGESSGKEWTVNASTAPGVPLWAHMKKQMDEGPDYAKFQRVGADTDAIVMLIFGGDGLSAVVTEKWQGKMKFEQPTDIGDIASCSYLIREYLKLNPEGRAYIYTAWPTIPEVKDLRRRIQQEAFEAAKRPGEKRHEVMKRITTRKPNDENMEPLRRSFDYAVHWLKDYDPANPRGNTHCRAHMFAVMEGLKRNFADLWEDDRLGMIPMGDVFLELDKKMRAGEVPGLVNVGEYSADGGHLRSGLPRYTLAATYYAVLFRDHPENVDWKVFQDRSARRASNTSLKYHFTALPAELQGMQCVVVRRGDSKKNAEGFAFMINAPTEVYIAVHDRGEFVPPEGWRKLALKTKWSKGLTDTVYVKRFETGTVTVPGHSGKEGSNYGLPHAAFVPAGIAVTLQ
jgi:hypothetical protein